MTVDYKEIVDQLFIKTIATGNQELWNHLYPLLDNLKYKIDKNIIDHFEKNISGYLENIRDSVNDN